MYQFFPLFYRINDKNECILCSDYLYKEKCYKKCPEGTKTNYLLKTCTSCGSLDLVYYKGSCYFQCPLGYSPNPEGICKKCSDSNLYYENGNCVIFCKTGDEPINMICSPYYGFYLNGEKVNSSLVIMIMI